MKLVKTKHQHQIKKKKKKSQKKEELGFDGKKRKSQKMEFSNQTQLKKIELFLFG